MGVIILFGLFITFANCDLYKNVKYSNITLEPANRQLLDFKLEHPLPIGLWTKSAGDPTEVRETVTVNSDIFTNQLLLDSMTHLTAERVPERVVHAKGGGAYGYFEVTHDVSDYTYADVFNGIGKKTPLVARFSSAVENLGGTDLAREIKGLGVKLYTKEGNLDFTALQIPVYFYRNTHEFVSLVHSFKRNPKTNLFDLTARWDAVTMNPVFAHTFFWTLTDVGIPNGYRRMDAFPIHTYELANKKGEVHYVRFNFRTEQGFSYLTTAEAMAISGRDPDYFNRDLYNAIERKEYPAWKLEMDVMTLKDIQNVDFDPFDVTRLWKNGTYYTVQVGRMVLNKNVDNFFKVIEQSAFNPAHLVPGIPGPVDFLFKGRRLFYRDTQNYRLGRNHNKIFVNMPRYAKTINRDGTPPVRDNERDAPNYYPNSFNGAIPYVDERIPKKKLIVLENRAVDLEPLWELYNIVLGSEDHKQRFVNNIVLSLVPVVPHVQKRAIRFLFLVDKDLGTRVTVGLKAALAQAQAEQNAQRTTMKPIVVPDLLHL